MLSRKSNTAVCRKVLFMSAQHLLSARHLVSAVSFLYFHLGYCVYKIYDFCTAPYISKMYNVLTTFLSAQYLMATQLWISAQLSKSKFCTTSNVYRCHIFTLLCSLNIYKVANFKAALLTALGTRAGQECISWFIHTGNTVSKKALTPGEMWSNLKISTGSKQSFPDTFLVMILAG